MSVRLPPSGGAARGQHFLRSSSLADTLVAEAGIAPGDLVVDVGAGRGALIGALRRADARVIALEIDATLAAGLRRRFDNDARVSVVAADARTWPWPAEPFSVVANLPFAGAAAVLRSLLDDPNVPLQFAYVIVQWELAAKRAATCPVTLQSVYWAAWWRLAVARRLVPAAFAPPPPVVSAVLAIEPRDTPLVPRSEHALYRAFLERAWADKPLRVTLRGMLGPRELKLLAAANGFDDRALPRDIDARQWAAACWRASRPAARSTRELPAVGGMVHGRSAWFNSSASASAGSISPGSQSITGAIPSPGRRRWRVTSAGARRARRDRVLRMDR